MSRLLDKLRGAQRSREESAILFDALKKAHSEREASRRATEAIVEASESDEEFATTDASASPVAPKRRDGSTAAIIALLVVAAAVCAAVAWRGTADVAHPSQLRIDPALDLKRLQPQEVAPEATPAATAKKRKKE
jgi:ferric-dicitrate binding protein FerR (iron transport regulator)